MKTLTEIENEIAILNRQLSKIVNDEKKSVMNQLQEKAKEINKLVEDAKYLAHQHDLHFKYSSGYEEFDVYEWEQSSYC